MLLDNCLGAANQPSRAVDMLNKGAQGQVGQHIIDPGYLLWILTPFRLFARLFGVVRILIIISRASSEIPRPMFDSIH